MPKKDIDYSNTTIYKIYCKDTNMTDTYVGHTTNFKEREYSHMKCCENIHNNTKVYKTIRENGGWNNWDMVEIANYNCKDLIEAKMKEQYHYELLKSTLNSYPPYIDKNNYFCSICNLQCSGKTQYNKHRNCKSHNKNQEKDFSISLLKETLQKSLKKFCCENCDYYTCRLSQYERHLLTGKHKNNVKSTLNQQISTKNKEYTNIQNFKCICSKAYRDRTGLWRHKKICNYESVAVEEINKEEINYKEVILTLINQNKELQKQNQELQKQILDLIEKINISKDLNIDKEL